MATRLQKILWTLLCGTAVGLAGCYDSDGGGPTPPGDASADSASDAADEIRDADEEESPVQELYGVMPMYGSP